jgi:hypothetical protein
MVYQGRNSKLGFRASTDGGATFGPITNLSNSDNADSINTEISAEGRNIIVSWWEQNQTAMVPVARVSPDRGQIEYYRQSIWNYR